MNSTTNNKPRIEALLPIYRELQHLSQDFQADLEDDIANACHGWIYQAERYYHLGDHIGAGLFLGRADAATVGGRDRVRALVEQAIEVFRGIAKR